MRLEKARKEDLDELLTLYHAVTDLMEARGQKQWHWGWYPNENLLREDVEKQRIYVARGADGRPEAGIVILTEPEPDYADIEWLFGQKPAVFHRLAVRPDAQEKGFGRQVFLAAIDTARELGCDSLHVDTCEDNPRMQAVFRSLGMREAGVMYYEKTDSLRYFCFEMPLTEDCPMRPLPMRPAFRSGSATPWGGERLGTLWGKPIPGAPTGESLEISCIPGLESRDAADQPLTALIGRYGAAMAGRFAGQPFPLLLKLIDAKDKLSVQVHPDDAYAHEHEGGKLGKTEAWLILEADPGSELVYGIRPGTTLEQLREASLQGAAVGALLRRVPVKPGDVCFIPAGCVHAIGGGILLYEIQQSSDITYRFYDWDRKDKEGRGRELHLDKALAVTRTDFAPEPAHAGGGSCERVLDTKNFTLDLLQPKDETVAVPAVRDFGFLTALTDGLTLTAGTVVLKLKKGESLFIPARCPALTLTGAGRAALSMPVA